MVYIYTHTHTYTHKSLPWNVAMMIRLRVCVNISTICHTAALWSWCRGRHLNRWFSEEQNCHFFSYLTHILQYFYCIIAEKCTVSPQTYICTREQHKVEISATKQSSNLFKTRSNWLVYNNCNCFSWSKCFLQLHIPTDDVQLLTILHDYDMLSSLYAPIMSVYSYLG